MTAKGIEQAEKLAAHFDGVDLPYIFTSTKQRSAETAAPLLRSRPNTISMALSEFDEINARGVRRDALFRRARRYASGV